MSFKEPRFHIVEICPINHPKAEKLKETNKDMGHQVYCFHGYYILILGGDRVWSSATKEEEYKPIDLERR